MTMSTDAQASTAAPPRGGGAQRLVWRWHFYAGLFCIPFVLWLASTGALGLITLCISALALWWQRRPAGVLGAPRPAAPGTAVGGFVLIAIVLGLLLPLFGLSLLAVLLTERRRLRRIAPLRDFLGLSESRDQQARFTRRVHSVAARSGRRPADPKQQGNGHHYRLHPKRCARAPAAIPLARRLSLPAIPVPTVSPAGCRRRPDSSAAGDRRCAGTRTDQAAA